MRTSKNLIPTKSLKCICEFDICPTCGSHLSLCNYISGKKTVQNLSDVLKLNYQPKMCSNSRCDSHIFKSAEWMQVAPMHCTYGYDVIASIGWIRQNHRYTFQHIHDHLLNNVQISESYVRRLYYEYYLPLLACNEREYTDDLIRLSEKSGLILSLDGLAPEGGEPQLWVIRELQTNLTIRSGWLSEQSQVAFENFLQPIIESKLNIAAILSDKQRGLLPAINNLFQYTTHALCQGHYLKNISEKIAADDEAMKVILRKTVRKEVGPLIRPEHVEKPGVMTVTGLLPSPIEEEPPIEQIEKPASNEKKQDEIIENIMRRVRYLLTLKGRPPFRLAGVEMFECLKEVSDMVTELIQHISDERLIKLQKGLSIAFSCVVDTYNDLVQVADWLENISRILDPDCNATRSGDEVRGELYEYLDQIMKVSNENAALVEYGQKILKITDAYGKSIFVAYDNPLIPRTNNNRESEFRDLLRRLLMTTGQKGATRRLIQRSGAWEVIRRPDSFEEMVSEISNVGRSEFVKERRRVRDHRSRFCLHTRSKKIVRKKLDQLKAEWLQLPKNKT